MKVIVFLFVLCSVMVGQNYQMARIGDTVFVYQDGSIIKKIVQPSTKAFIKLAQNG